MAKQKKKRTKAYRGVDARDTSPHVVRVAAVERSWLGQWWFDHGRIARPILIAVAVGAFLLWMIIELIRIVL